MIDRGRARWTAILAAAVLLAGSGCASPERSADLERMAKYERDAGIMRAVAANLAGDLAGEANALEAARAANRDPAIEAAIDRLRTGRILIEALEEAAFTLALAHRFADLHRDLGLPPASMRRLESDVAAMTGIADREPLRVEAFARSLKSPYDLRALEKIRLEVERDQAALRAYRTDVGLTSRIGEGGGG